MPPGNGGVATARFPVVKSSHLSMPRFSQTCAKRPLGDAGASARSSAGSMDSIGKADLNAYWHAIAQTWNSRRTDLRLPVLLGRRSDFEGPMILVTGGAGYIGSHACVALLSAGEQIVVFDNFCNSSPEALDRVQRICGKPLAVVEGDIRDQDALESVLAQYGCTAVMHFAGLKSVQDSVAQPLEYYDQNVVGSQRLLRAMSKTGVTQIVFSSSATVYGVPHFLPCTEDHPLNPTNPYGRTKLIIEDMLRDQYASEPTWRIAILRYFNPVGAHESGLIGEDPKGVPSNLVPFVAQVAIGRRPRLNVFGADYDTPDRTGRRDYIHVMDLAAGHLSALRRLDA